jgi:hypothetical protein
MPETTAPICGETLFAFRGIQGAEQERDRSVVLTPELNDFRHTEWIFE